jgi:glycosyltransferase involved in cell wall biosynthesis
MIEISLIVATYGRDKELDDFLKSIAAQTYDLSKLEVIIVDQNDVIDLRALAAKYQPLYAINHVRSAEKGLSVSKNRGIKEARGAIVTFPDDDCCFYPDTVANALLYFQQHPEADVLYGRVYDRNAGKNIMRNWLNYDKKLNLANFHLNYSAITCFSKKKELLFDTRFGVGAFYGSGEELDYIITAIKKKYTVVYTHTIDVWHPPLEVLSMNDDKVYRYAKGYAAVLKKHACTELVILLMSSTAMQVLQLFKATLSGNRAGMRKRRLGIAGRVKGFFEFKRS